MQTLEALHQHIGKDGFRLRGTAMSRIDGFSDVVFGFALTLIVVSLEVPRTYDELHRTLIGFFPFAVCFLFLIMVWYSHFRFFRRYHLHDFRTIVINSALLFTVLFYVYPLKFLFNLITIQVLAPGAVADETHKLVPVFSAAWQIRELMVVYGAGFAATYFLLAALYWNAWLQRDLLHLNKLERTLTLTYMWDLFGVACVGLLCGGVAMIIPARQAGNAGWIFFVIGIYKTIHGTISGRRIRASRAACEPADFAPLPH
jgi:uncharacterized membrane protein